MMARAYVVALLGAALAVAVTLSGCRGSSNTAPVEIPDTGAAAVTEAAPLTEQPPDGAAGEQPAPAETPAGAAAQTPAAQKPTATPAQGAHASGSGGGGSSAAATHPAPAATPTDTKPAEPRTTHQARTGASQTATAPGGQGGEHRRQSLHERFDANGDGLLTAQELPEGLRERIMKADTNGDGGVSKEELEKAREATRGEARQGGGPGRGAGGGPGRGAGGDPGQMFQHLDTNGDGVLTAAELPERFRDRMMQADANHDGKLTREELDQAHAARERERAAHGEGQQNQ